ncbi:MAG: DNA polymerase III subunit epsilon, partial [Giesbergeria sp.]
MKRIDPRLLAAIALAGVVMALWLVLMSAIVWSTLSPPEREAVGEVLAGRIALVFVGWVLGLIAVAAALRVLHQRYVGAPHRLLEEVRVVLAARRPQLLK